MIHCAQWSAAMGSHCLCRHTGTNPRDDDPATPSSSNSHSRPPPSAARRTAACRLKPTLSAHRFCLECASLGAAACNGPSARAPSESPLVSAKYAWSCSSTNTPRRASSFIVRVIDPVQRRLQRCRTRRPPQGPRHDADGPFTPPRACAGSRRRCAAPGSGGPSGRAPCRGGRGRRLRARLRSRCFGSRAGSRRP